MEFPSSVSTAAFNFTALHQVILIVTHGTNFLCFNSSSSQTGNWSIVLLFDVLFTAMLLLYHKCFDWNIISTLIFTSDAAGILHDVHFLVHFLELLEWVVFDFSINKTALAFAVSFYLDEFAGVYIATKFVAKLEPDVANCNNTLLLEIDNCADTHECNISVFLKTNLVRIFSERGNFIDSSGKPPCTCK